jgi:hypothetical protein
MMDMLGLSAKAGVSVTFYFSNNDPVAECQCGDKFYGDSPIDVFRAWWRHLPYRQDHREAMSWL